MIRNKNKFQHEPRNRADIVIENFHDAVGVEEDHYITVTTEGAAGGKVVTITQEFGSVFFQDGDVLRISDGTTTIDYIAHADSGVNNIQHGMATSATNQFVSKINASALNINATDNGGSDTNSSFTLLPGTGATITITEDPGGDGNFGQNAGYCVIADYDGTTTKKIKAAPFRFLNSGAFNIRQQSSVGSYRTFIGEQES